MLVRTRLKWALALAVVAIAGTPALAQPTGDTDARVDVRRPVAMSGADQLHETEAVIGRMDLARNGVRRQLETARAKRDVVKTLCLNDKLNQLDVATRTARERRQTLQSAVERSDVELSKHEFTVIKVLQQRSEQLTAEANLCVGEQEAFLGTSRVTLVIDRNLPPPSNETEFPVSNPDDVVAEVPKCTSCVR
jgi:hypothetical protein